MLSRTYSVKYYLYGDEKKNNPVKYISSTTARLPTHLFFQSVRTENAKAHWKQKYHISRMGPWETLGHSTYSTISLELLTLYHGHASFFFSQRSILFPSPRQPSLLHFAWGSDHLAEPIPNPSDPHLADHGQADT